MADMNNKPTANQGESWFTRCINWFKQLPTRIATPFKNMVNELKRVTWPTRRKLIIYSITVLLFMLFMMVVVGAFDLGSSALVKTLHFGGGTGAAVTAATATATDLTTQVINEAEDAAVQVETTAEDAAQVVTDTAEGAVQTVEDAAQTVEDAAQTVTDTAEDAAAPAQGN